MNISYAISGSDIGSIAPVAREGMEHIMRSNRQAVSINASPASDVALWLLGPADRTSPQGSSPTTSALGKYAKHLHIVATSEGPLESRVHGGLKRSLEYPFTSPRGKPRKRTWEHEGETLQRRTPGGLSWEQYALWHLLKCLKLILWCVVL